jgi:hypothetical protein
MKLSVKLPENNGNEYQDNKQQQMVFTAVSKKECLKRDRFKY